MYTVFVKSKMVKIIMQLHINSLTNKIQEIKNTILKPQYTIGNGNTQSDNIILRNNNNNKKVDKWVSLCCSVVIKHVIVMDVLYLNSMINNCIRKTSDDVSAKHTCINNQI